MDLDAFELEIEGEVLEYILANELKAQLDDAKKYYDKNIGDDHINNFLSLDFTSWLIYDYKLPSKKTFLESYYTSSIEQLSEEKAAFIKQIMNSYPSLYILKERSRDKGLLKDLFTNKEISIDIRAVKQLELQDLVFARIILINDEAKLFGNKAYIPGVFKTSIERNMFMHYQNYKARMPYGSWSGFLAENQLLLYKAIAVVADIISNEIDEEEKYTVWQSTYIIKDGRNIKKLLKAIKDVKQEPGEDEYYKIIYKEHIIAEMVLINNQLELECTSEKDRDIAKKIIEAALGQRIIHYKDEIISLDDLI